MPEKDKDKQKEKGLEPIDNWNISLMLDTYEDIFSDFDPRHFSQRAISQDFLEECRRATREKAGRGLEIRMMMPAKGRDAISEGIIRERLHKHFVRHHKDKVAEEKRIKREGIAYFLIGAALMLAAGYVMSMHLPEFPQNLLLVILEPAGWFLFWTGLETIKERKSKVPDLEFYGKMASAEFNFLSY